MRQTLSLTVSGEITTLGVGEAGTLEALLLIDFDPPKRKLDREGVDPLDCAELVFGETREVWEEEGVVLGEPLLDPLALEATLFGLDLFIAELLMFPPLELFAWFEDDPLLLSFSFSFLPDRDCATWRDP